MDNQDTGQIGPTGTDTNPSFIPDAAPQQAPPPNKNKFSLGKKQMYLIGAGLLAVILAVAAYLVFGAGPSSRSDDSSDSANGDSNSAVEEEGESVLNVYIDGYLNYLRDNNTLHKTTNTLGLTEKIEHAFASFLGAQFYATGENSNYYTASPTEPKLTERNGYYASGLVSPDGSKEVFFNLLAAGEKLDPTIGLRDVTTGQETTLLSASTEKHGNLVPLGWIDNSKIIVQRYTCFECDGPALPRFYTVDIGTKKVAELVSITEEDAESGSAVMVPGSKKMIIQTGPHTLEQSYDKYIDTNEAFYLYDIATDKLTKLYDEKDEVDSFNNVVGWSSDFKNFIFPLAKVSKVKSAAQFGSDVKREVKALVAVDISSGRSASYPIEISDLAYGEHGAKGSITQAAMDSQRLIFVTRLYENNANKLRVLPITGGEVAVETIASSSSAIVLFNFETLVIPGL